ncbi:MAG: RNHCP domain-containing protein [Clostridia bacterium]
MPDTLFKKKDSGFVCANCKKTVLPLGYSSRNHCPYCLCSLHLDNSPGDRACDCAGIMRPVAVTTDSRRGFIITHKCEQCGHIRNNRSQKDDDTELLIKLTNPYER